MSTRRRRRSSGAPVIILTATWPGADLPGQNSFAADTGQVFNRVLIDASGTLGTWDRTGNKIRRGGGGGGYNGLVADIGVADFLLNVITGPTNQLSAGLCFRWAAADSAIITDFAALDGHLGSIYKRTAGTFTNLGNWSGVPIASTHEIECRGNQITVRNDGANVLSISDSYNNTATKVGFSDSTAISNLMFGKTTVTA